MASMANSDALAVQLEVVAKLVSEFYEFEDALCSRFQKIMTMDQSSRDLRIPIPMAPGGKFRQGSFDGGGMGRGSGGNYQVATLTPIDQWIALEINDKVALTTDSTVKSIADIVAREVGQQMAEFKNYKDALLQTSGTGILGTVTSFAVLTATLATPFYAQLLRQGQPITVYNAAQTTLRGTATITAIDQVAGTITIDADPGVVATDKICLGGLTATPPTSLFGLAYHHNSASTGSWLGLSRVTYPGVRTPTVTASSSLTTVHPQLLLAKMELALGSNIFDTGKWFWYMHQSQHLAWVELGQLISEIHLQQNNAPNGAVDLLMSRRQMRRIAGFEVMTSIHADRTRVDMIDSENWLRGTYKETGLHSMGGQTKLPTYDATGGYGNSSLSYISNSEQYAVKNPRRGGYVSGLTEYAGL